MSALRVKVGSVAAALGLLFGSSALAQQAERDYQRDASGVQLQDRSDSQLRTGQTIETRQPGQQYTAQFRGTQRATGSEAEVGRFLAGCLLAKNQAEVELGQFAQQQSQNPEVKEFAQRMVQDHQQMVEKLQQVAGTQASAGSRSTPGTSTTPGAASQLDSQRQTSDTTRLPGSPGATQSSRDAAQSLAATGQQSGALNEIAQIERQIAERQTEATREELQQKQGAAFDKAYVGCMIGEHVHMQAALEVIQQQGPSNLQQLAQQALPKVEQHLQHAKQLMQQLESHASATNQAERQPSRTQR
jgi:predicted outer membrane protein